MELNSRSKEYRKAYMRKYKETNRIQLNEYKKFWQRRKREEKNKLRAEWIARYRPESLRRRGKIYKSEEEIRSKLK